MKKFRNTSLKPYNTFHIDVKAESLLIIEDENDFNHIMNDYDLSNGKSLIIGEGSNLLFTQDFLNTIINEANKTINSKSIKNGPNKSIRIKI